MAFFKKKSDPISARARDLNDKIARLEAEIQRLAENSAPVANAVPENPVPPAPPRLRSTAVPHGPTITGEKADAFLDVPEQRRIKETQAKPAPPKRPDLGTARSDFGSMWGRFKNNFRGPATSNPKLVNYLAAGSIQGLRPLRYEKRVARNRFIVLSGILILLLWGIVAIFFRHR